MCVCVDLECVGNFGKRGTTMRLIGGGEKYVFGRLWGVVLDSKEKGRNLGRFVERFRTIFFSECAICVKFFVVNNVVVNNNNPWY